MSDNGSGFFTRADWRPSKKRRMRKRVNHYGGCKTAPPAFLEAAKRCQFKRGLVGAKLCSATKRNGEPCRMVALGGLAVCGAHGGFSIWAKQGKLQPTGRSAAVKAAARAAMPEDHTPAAAVELTSLRFYQEASPRDRMRMIRAWGTPGWQTLISQLKQQLGIAL